MSFEGALCSIQEFRVGFTYYPEVHRNIYTQAHQEEWMVLVIG